MKTPFFSFYDKLILGRPLLSLVVMLLVIGWLSTYIPSFKLDASADALVLEGDDALKYYREISARYSTEEFLLVTFHPEQDLLSDKSLAVLDQLRAELAALEGVSSVVTILDVPLLESPRVTLEDVASGDGLRSLRTENIDKELVRAELKNSPIYKNLLTGTDGQTTALQVNLIRDEKYHSMLTGRESMREQLALGDLSLEEQEQLKQLEIEFSDYAAAAGIKQSQLVDKVRLILDSYRSEGQLFLGGVPMIAADMVSFVKSDLVTFGGGIIAFIILTLAIIFRQAVWVLLPLATCILSTLFMLGLITLLDWRMTVISSNFVALLLIITLSITIHLVVRYRELLTANPDADQRTLVQQTASLMIKPCIYTTLTTIVAFASLVVSGIRPVIDFGWMMTIGVTSALIITFIVYRQHWFC
jgi:predicted RND superfamily exporter protein